MEDLIKALNEAEAEVVQPQGEAPVESVEVKGQPAAEPDKTREVAKPKQSAEENAKFAEMRRTIERLEKTLEAKEADTEKYRLAFEAAKESDGWRGDDPISFADEKTAERTGRTQIEVRQERELKQRQTQTEREYKKSASELDTLRQELVFKQDLISLRDAFPDDKLTDVRDLGETFIKMRAAGVEAVEAYRYIRGDGASKPSAAKSTQPEMGSAGKSTGADSDYYTEAELDRLTKKQLENEAVMQKALRSLSRLNKK